MHTALTGSSNGTQREKGGREREEGREGIRGRGLHLTFAEHLYSGRPCAKSRV